MEPTDLVSRLDRLETAHRRLGRINLLIGLGVCVAFLVGQAAPQAQKLEASELVIVDNGGTPRATLSGTDKGATLSFFAARGAGPTLMLGSGATGDMLAMGAEKGDTFTVRLKATQEDGWRPALVLNEPSGSMVLLGSGDDGTAFVSTDAMLAKSFVAVGDDKGKRAELMANGEGASLQLYSTRATSAGVSLLSGPKGDALLMGSEKGGNTPISLQAAESDGWWPLLRMGKPDGWGIALTFPEGLAPVAMGFNMVTKEIKWSPPPDKK